MRVSIHTILLIIILTLASFLRIWKLDEVPVSLFGDEADVGYHAYSILKTGRDYTGNLALFYVNSIADKKAPLYSYVAVPTIAIFGLNPLGVRLPAAIFGIWGVFLVFLIGRLLTNRNIGLIAAFLLAVSPWHIQFSRWGLEHTLMLGLFLFGIYFFLISSFKKKQLFLSSIFLSLTPYAYHAAKVFLPLFLAAISVIFWKDIRKNLKNFTAAFLLIIFIVSGPIFLNSIFGDSAERFSSLSIATDAKNVGEIGFAREKDIQMESPNGQLFHNKFTLLLQKIEKNYLQSFSTEFLFIRGDINLRHSTLQNGEFYKYQFFFLIAGFVFLALKVTNVRYKLLLLSWLLLSPFPAMITVDGGGHAARLFFMIPPIIIIIAIGIYYGFFAFGKAFQKIYLFSIILVILASFLFYQHNYWIHYPYESEKWWQAGYKEAIEGAVSEGKKYEKVIISTANEPPLIFFLAFFKYPPSSFQNKYPLVFENLENFGEVSKLDKYYFPKIGMEKGLYDLGSILPANALYLATAKEIKLDLVKEPGRVPGDLTLIKSIMYPSGEPAFYLFAKK